MSSGKAQILLDIKNRLQTSPAPVTLPASLVFSKTGNFVSLWNNTLKRLRDGKLPMTMLPLISLRYMKPLGIKTLGNVVQDFSMKLEVHCIHKFLNANDGLVSFDQDLSIFEFTDWTYMMLENFMPTNCGTMVRVDEDVDDDHDQIVDHIQVYEFRYIDSLLDQPVGGQIMDPPPALDITTNPMTIS
jgi:hypothetical protein